MLRKVGWVIFAIILFDVFIHMFGSPPPPAAPITKAPVIEHPADVQWHVRNGEDPCSTKEMCDIWHAITDPDDGVPVQPGVPCQAQPTADSESRCVLAKYPPPANSDDGAAYCNWQRTIFAQINVPIESCSVNGKDY